MSDPGDKNTTHAAANSTSVIAYLAREEATHTDDTQDVEDSWAHDGAYPDVTFGNENTWGGSHTGSVKLSQSAQMTVHYLTFYECSPAAAKTTNTTFVTCRRKYCGCIAHRRHREKKKINSFWIIHCSILFRVPVSDCSAFECGSILLYIKIITTFTFQH